MLDSLLKAGRESAVAEAPPYVAGRWGGDGSVLTRTGPYVRREVSRTTAATGEDIDRALSYARTAARTVASLSPAARAQILDRAAHAALAHREDLARLLALELGKPVKDGRGEIDRVADTLSVCAAEARQIGGEMLPVAGWQRGVGNTALTYRAPAGITLAITPFNAPANLLAHKLGASFAAGNTTLVKAPPQAPASTAAIVALLLEAGLPPQAVQLLHGGGEVGAL
ncbi:aldehyde dehydrogenase family protein, partial [Streptomyces sp. N35]|uniref:aldehyde dehydrogenase family protein n=1 Tax=Streptomyces sp. N35 TaxID=2795730 RepID=UPI0018F394C6